MSIQPPVHNDGDPVFVQPILRRGSSVTVRRDVPIACAADLSAARRDARAELLELLAARWDGVALDLRGEWVKLDEAVTYERDRDALTFTITAELHYDSGQRPGAG